MGQLSGERLIALARASDADSRHTLLLALGDLCAERPFGLGEDAETTEDVFLRLARGAELAVRAQLSARLAATPWAPRALILFLAGDRIEAAGPVLSGSPVLREADLVDIATRMGLEHRRALARRPGLPGPACEAVARAQESDVIGVLLDNPTAELAGPALRHCLTAAGETPALWDALIARPELDEAALTDAYRAVGVALQAEICARFPEYAARIGGEIDNAVAAALQARDPGGHGLSANERLVQEIDDSGGLDGSFLLEAVEDGRIDLFEIALTRLCDLPCDALSRARADHDPKALALAIRAAGLMERDCARIGAALGRVGRLAFDAAGRSECAAAFRGHTTETARAALLRTSAGA